MRRWKCLPYPTEAGPSGPMDRTATSPRAFAAPVGDLARQVIGGRSFRSAGRAGSLIDQRSEGSDGRS